MLSFDSILRKRPVRELQAKLLARPDSDTLSSNAKKAAKTAGSDGLFSPMSSLIVQSFLLNYLCVDLYFFICSPASPLRAQSSDWAELPLPGSGNISALYAQGSMLLAARAIGLQNTGVYHSTDSGRSWTELAGFEANTDGSIVGCFVAGKDALFAAGRGVLRHRREVRSEAAKLQRWQESQSHQSGD